MKCLMAGCSNATVGKKKYCTKHQKNSTYVKRKKSTNKQSPAVRIISGLFDFIQDRVREEVRKSFERMVK